MTTKLKLKLVPTGSPRPYLEIVKALQLDSVQLPATVKTKPVKGKGGATHARAANDGSIPESGRNNTLMSMAGAMRNKGMSESAISAALQAENLANCKPPLDPAEVSAIATSVMRYAAADRDKLLKSLTDTGNAARFADRYKDRARFVYGRGWVIWDELQWRQDATGQIMELAKALARTIQQEAAGINDSDVSDAVSKHAKASQQAPKLKAMLELAASEPELAALHLSLDSHDMLLGVANGVVNLKTGKLQPARREDMLTLHSTVVFDAMAQCPQFMAFLDQVTGGDKQLANYLQRVVGYALTGLTIEQCLFFLFGKGLNGKSTFLNVVKAVVGTDLAKQTPTETLMAKRNSGTNDIARLQNVRVVVANEIEDGSMLAESLVKQMTGGEAMAARFHYAEFFDFLPKFKLFIAGNHKPTIRGRDNGIWRRIRLVPFVVTIAPEQRDPLLQEKLLAELPGILNWAIKGCLDWQKVGLHEPQVVTEAVSSYREEMDIISQWVSDCCKVGVNLELKASEAYQSYKNWAEQNGYKPMAAGTFSRDLGDRFPKKERNIGNFYQGVSGRG
jgi:putative DNA primase/helicase